MRACGGLVRSFFLVLRLPPGSTGTDNLFHYTTLVRAVLGRHLAAHQPVLAQQADVLEREFTAFVERFGAGTDLLLRDAPRNVLDHQLFFGEPNIHVARSALESDAAL